MSRISDASATRRNRSALTALAVAGTLALGGAATAPRAEAATRTPVVFVHGYAESPSNWSAAKASFEAAGYPASDLFTYQYTWTQSNKTSAQGLASYVQQVLTTTGASQVDIVNHSMGGMVTNWYVNELGGQPYVKHMASLAGANHGSSNASSCQTYTSCQEMYPGSSFLTTVNSGDETPGSTKYATWYSPCDGMINPYTSTKLAGATNNYVACETHMAYLSDATILSAVRKFLTT
ncbi:triacylglycerol lipase [Streptomyces sp. NBC_00063]|uniref:esterase/lipase family protein n=1 Tax=Streptomyces sp. NBC_00063 TaxID=2975638 RepID=UPI002250BB29|nr:alpha/beta fold hydrolase [Streptomyces sp. NBC_00063]MCX5435679.1 alpha/beta hydrolase [Streptomyces sp. NBC_00063]